MTILSRSLWRRCHEDVGPQQKRSYSSEDGRILRRASKKDLTVVYRDPWGRDHYKRNGEANAPGLIFLLPPHIAMFL